MDKRIGNENVKEFANSMIEEVEIISCKFQEAIDEAAKDSTIRVQGISFKLSHANRALVLVSSNGIGRILCLEEDGKLFDAPCTCCMHNEHFDGLWQMIKESKVKKVLWKSQASGGEELAVSIHRLKVVRKEEIGDFHEVDFEVMPPIMRVSVSVGDRRF